MPSRTVIEEYEAREERAVGRLDAQGGVDGRLTRLREVEGVRRSTQRGAHVGGAAAEAGAPRNIVAAERHTEGAARPLMQEEAQTAPHLGVWAEGARVGPLEWHDLGKRGPVQVYRGCDLKPSALMEALHEFAAGGRDGPDGGTGHGPSRPNLRAACRAFIDIRTSQTEGRSEVR